MMIRINKISIGLLLALTLRSFAQTEFITIWDLSQPGAAATELTFGVVTAGTVNYIWETYPSNTLTGSGTFSGTTFLATGLPANQKIKLKIANTNFQRININYGTDKSRLIDITQWGTTVWTSMQSAFFACNNLAGSGASDMPNLTNVTDMSEMFTSASSFNQSIGGWNTSNVINMFGMFANASVFNQPIGNWNTANVTNMQYMFESASVFNQPISNWNTSHVINMSYMFNEASSFNQSIGGWNTSNVIDMRYMFANTFAFNQPIGGWNTSNVIDMSDMFANTFAFNQPIGGWITSNVTDMSWMFSGASAYNQSIGGWNTGNVTNMQYMFYKTSSFNQSIGGWNIGNVTDMGAMFGYANAFNQNLGAWGAKLNPSLFIYIFSFLDYSGMNGANYDALLIGFNAGTLTGRTMGAAGLNYCNAGAARASLISKGWTIIDGGIGVVNITTQPLANATVCSGIFEPFSVSASGSNLSYLWSNNATTSGINTSVIGSYLVTVTGACGSPQISNTASLTNYLPTSIFTQPQVSNYCSDIATISVSATGSNLSYLWSNGLSTTTSMNTSIQGFYMVTVTGSCGSVISNTALFGLIPCSNTGVSSSIAPYSFEIYPNPNSGSFVIDVPLSEKADLLNYTVTSIDGKIVMSGSLSDGVNQISTDLPIGLYLVVINNRALKLLIE